MPLYNFYWDNGREGFVAEINAKPEIVKKLLEEYRNRNEDYNNVGFIEFLQRNGVKARIVVSYSSNSPVEIHGVDEDIYF